MEGALYGSQPAESSETRDGVHEEVQDLSPDEAGEANTLAPDRRTSEGGPESGLVYYREVGKVALLRAEEEVDLAKRIEAGVFAWERLQKAMDLQEQLDPQLRRDLAWLVHDGETAKKQMLEANLRLVIPLAKRYMWTGMPLLDLIQNGNLGLIEAVERFDHTKGFRFSTYATWLIRQSITRAIGNTLNTIRLPIALVEVISKVKRKRRELTQELDREPTNEELAQKLDMPIKKVTELLSFKEPISTDLEIGEDGTKLLSLIEDPKAVNPLDAVIEQTMSETLSTLLQQLPARQAEVIRLKFGLVDGTAHTLEEIGRLFGLPKGNVLHLETRALEQLKKLAAPWRYDDEASAEQPVAELIKEEIVAKSSTTSPPRRQQKPASRADRRQRVLESINAGNAETVVGILEKEVILPHFDRANLMPKLQQWFMTLTPIQVQIEVSLLGLNGGRPMPMSEVSQRLRRSLSSCQNIHRSALEKLLKVLLEES